LIPNFIIFFKKFAMQLKISALRSHSRLLKFAPGSSPAAVSVDELRAAILRECAIAPSATWRLLRAGGHVVFTTVTPRAAGTSLADLGVIDRDALTLELISSTSSASSVSSASAPAKVKKAASVQFRRGFCGRTRSARVGFDRRER
jgi:hypothetical protein